jgi:hypothetical protein
MQGNIVHMENEANAREKKKDEESSEAVNEDRASLERVPRPSPPILSERKP